MAVVLDSDSKHCGLTKIIRFEGNDYATLDDRDPTGNHRTDRNTGRVPLPTGWEICQSNARVARAVIKKFPWSTHVLYTANGDAWPTANPSAEEERPNAVKFHARTMRGSGYVGCAYRCGGTYSNKDTNWLLGTYKLDHRDGAYTPQRRGLFSSILIRLMPVPPVLLTLHLAPQDNGAIALSVMDMGGGEAASFQARPDDLLGDERAIIAQQVGEAQPGMIQLLGPDGRLLTAADDPKRLAELAAADAEPEDGMSCGLML